MRNYQQKKSNPYYMPHDVYMQALYKIKGYHELVRRRQKILHSSPPPPDGMPRGTLSSNPTEKKALVLAVIDADLEAIEQAIIELQGKYSKTCTGEEFDAYEAFMDYGVFCYYRSKPRRDEGPHRSTWNRYRSEFAYLVMKKLNYF